MSDEHEKDEAKSNQHKCVTCSLQRRCANYIAKAEAPTTNHQNYAISFKRLR